MTRDEKQAKAFNAEYDGFEVRYEDGSWKLFYKFGYALNYARKHFMGQPHIIGHKLDLENLESIETVLL